MNNACYFWKDGGVVEGSVSHHDVQKAGLSDLYCVDTSCKPAERRYGIYEKHIGWKSRPLESFPPEFRMHLLLLGVS